MPTINKIIRSKRKTIALVVDAEGKLIIRTPKRATKRQINALIKNTPIGLRKSKPKFAKRKRALPRASLWREKNFIF